MMHNRSFMKKIYFIAIIIFLVSALGVICIDKFLDGICPDNISNIELTVEKVDIRDINSYDNIFHLYGWDETLLKQVRNDSDHYVIVSVQYRIRNKSDTLTMKDIRFIPKFDGELNDSLKMYNVDNGTYYIYVEPLSNSGMTQDLLFKIKDDKNEVLNNLKNQQVDMTYFTGCLSSSNGRGLYGIGKHHYKFQIGDFMQVGRYEEA